MSATISLLGLSRINPDILSDLVLPDGLDADLVKDNLLAETAELEVIYPDAIFMQAMIGRKKKMSEMYDGFIMYPQVLENVRVADKKAAQADEDVVRVIKEVEETLGDSGRILVRESGTEPVVRVMVEAETTEVCQEMVNKVVEVMKKKGL